MSVRFLDFIQEGCFHSRDHIVHTIHLFIKLALSEVVVCTQNEQSEKVLYCTSKHFLISKWQRVLWALVSIPIQTLCHFTFPIFQFPVITIWHRKPASIPPTRFFLLLLFLLLRDSYSYSHYCKCPGHWPSPLYFPSPLTRVPSPPVSTGKSWCYRTISAWVAMVSEFHVFQSWALADWPVTLALNPFLVNRKGSHKDASLLRQSFQNFRNGELRQAIHLDTIL